MLDLIGAIVVMSAIGINLVAFTNALPGTLAHRLGLAAIAGAWVGLASGLGAAGTINQITATFAKLSIKDVDLLRLQTRPYQFVEIKDVQLWPKTAGPGPK